MEYIKLNCAASVGLRVKMLVKAYKAYIKEMTPFASAWLILREIAWLLVYLEPDPDDDLFHIFIDRLV